MADKHKDIYSLLLEVLEQPTTQERAAYMDNVCQNDPGLRAELESLLRAHEQAGSFLESPTGNTAVTMDPAPLTLGPGTVMGPYKLLEKIGEGGMAVVYMAEQEEPFRRRVALKVVKLGMDTKQVIARFEAERQALAMMDHPNIAKVFDAGTMDTGRPYFVMELVRGISITDYCDKNTLNTRERLDLFVQVCHAVQHAHQKGIIHRDLKPSNIMITLHEGKPLPVVIDFGIAKATSQRLTEKTLFTKYAQMIGTPVYMSPEQAEMSRLDVDTRTDIYSLGVLLYELLTGTLPFDTGRLLEAGYLEIQRIIREEEADKPSTRLSTIGDDLEEIARHRKTSPESLTKLVRGDLDWIVMKLLEKDPTRRYSTAVELVTDIERHFNSEPVQAGAPTTAYILRKFIRRHRVGVSAGLLVVLSLVLGLAVSTVMYVQAEEARWDTQAQREIAEEALVQEAAARRDAERQAKITRSVNDFLNEGLLSSANPARARGRNVTVREILDIASKTIEKKFEDEPVVKASIRSTLGQSYVQLGEYTSAEPHLEYARDTFQSQLGNEHIDTLASRRHLGILYSKTGRHTEAESIILDILQRSRRILGEKNPMTLTFMASLAKVHMSQNRYEQGQFLLEETLEMLLETLGETHPKSVSVMGSLASAYIEQGLYAEAEGMYAEVFEIRRRFLGETHPDALSTMGNIAILYLRQGRHKEAESLLIRTSEIKRRVLGEEHPLTLHSQQNLGVLYLKQERHKEAQQLFETVLQVTRRVLGEEHPQTLKCMYSLGASHTNQKQYQEARPLLETAMEAMQRVLGNDHPDTLTCRDTLGLLFYKQSHYEDAQTMWERVLIARQNELEQGHPKILKSMNRLAMVYKAQERYLEAERLLETVLKTRQRQLGDDHADTLDAMHTLGLLYAKETRYEDAERLLEETVRLRRRVLGETHTKTAESVRALTSLYETWGKSK
jgi:eukaryotic-like serine/threonine-protein kinase